MQRSFKYVSVLSFTDCHSLKGNNKYFLSYLGPVVIHPPAGMVLVKRPAIRGEQTRCWGALAIFVLKYSL